MKIKSMWVLALFLLIAPMIMAADNIPLFLSNVNIYSSYNELGNNLAVKSYNKDYNAHGNTILEIKIIDNGATKFSSREQLVNFTAGEKTTSDYNIDLRAYKKPYLYVNYLNENSVYLEKNLFSISEIIAYYGKPEPYSLNFVRNKDETTTYNSFRKSLKSDNAGFMSQGTQNTVDIYLDSMTVDEDDQSDNDCGNSYEDVYYDEDYSSEEFRAIFSLGFPSDYSSKVPAGAIIES